MLWAILSERHHRVTENKRNSISTEATRLYVCRLGTIVKRRAPPSSMCRLELKKSKGGNQREFESLRGTVLHEYFMTQNMFGQFTLFSPLV